MKRILAVTVCALLLMATSAMAVPVLDTGYNWINAPFWTNTDTTTPPADGNSQFALTFEQAFYESDFGLFSVTGDYTNPGAVDTKFQIFSYSQDPTTTASGNPGTKTTVFFQNDGSVSLDGSTYTAFDKMFGFYFDVHTGGPTDTTADYFYYTYNGFNMPNSAAGTDHILTAFNELTHEVLIYLDDQLMASGSDRDFNDMVVYGNDLTPVPEPGTLLLLGSGLIGLAFLKRRKQA